MSFVLSMMNGMMEQNDHDHGDDGHYVQTSNARFAVTTTIRVVVVGLSARKTQACTTSTQYHQR
jgi:hypothetical protein